MFQELCHVTQQVCHVTIIVKLHSKRRTQTFFLQMFGVQL